MRLGLDPQLIKAASLHVRSMDKEALLNVASGAAVNPMFRNLVGKARTYGQKALDAGRSAWSTGVRGAGSATKLVGGTLGAGMVVSALPQAAAHARQRYDLIRNEYDRQGGI